MTVLDFAADDLFVLRTIKHLATNPANKWANSYEFRAITSGGEDELLGAVDAFTAFEAIMSLATVVFDHALVSTWEPDSKPYDPFTFMSVPLTLTGSGASATDPLPLSQCLSVARVPSSGRFGHIFYRGWLKEGDVSAPAGIPVLTDAAALQSELADAITTSEVSNYLGGGEHSALELVMIDAAGNRIRSIRQLVIQGVAQLPTDHAWFNRTTTP